MRAKIEVSQDGGATILGSFWYQGSGGARTLSPIARAKFPGKNITHLRTVISGFPNTWWMIEPVETKVWCQVCQTHVDESELRKWSGDDALHYLCPGCGSDLKPVRNLDKEYDQFRRE